MPARLNAKRLLVNQNGKFEEAPFVYERNLEVALAQYNRGSEVKDPGALEKVKRILGNELFDRLSAKPVPYPCDGFKPQVEGQKNGVQKQGAHSGRPVRTNR